jgi:hypothetical protein
MLALLASCVVLGHGAFTRPDNAWACTPGHYDQITRAAACTHKDRPYLPAAVRREILAIYHVPGWTGRDGELDHRVPFWAGGTTDRANLWPERGRIPNPKDELESYVYRRVCTGRPSPMRLRTARRIFQGNWVAYYRFYHLDRD